MKILVYTCNIFFVFRFNSTMSSTTCNDVTNMKPNWGCCFLMFFVCFFLSKIASWPRKTTPQYTFLVWKCMIRLMICAHCSLCRIRCFRINMMLVWHHGIFICFIYVLCFFTRPSALRILAFTFQFFRYLSRQDSNDAFIILVEM